MNNSLKLVSLSILLAFTQLVFAQKGTLRGTVIDDETGEPLFSANAILKGTTFGATTDFDGNFEVQAPAGTYELSITFIGMSGTLITGVEVVPGEVTVIGNIRLKPASNELDAVTITAEAVRNTEAALITVKRKSANVIDGISSAKLQKTGDSDAGDAAKRVTGVSVEGGKYVYVRGLGDRYTKTMLNGVDIPGLDPDRNAIQIDIFPTNLISNMTILKSGLAELPADFAGGLVNIETKDFPTDKFLKVSAGIGFTPGMHFNSNYISYEGSGTDFLGFDGGARALPEGGGSTPVPNPLEGTDPQRVNEFLNDFNPTLGATKRTSLMDFSLGLSMGNQYTRENGDKWGYIFATTYKNETKFYEDVEYGEYIRPSASDAYELIYTTRQSGQQSQRNTLLGALGGVTYKTFNSKYKFNVMHLQNGESRTSQFVIDNSEQGGAVGQSGYRAYVNNLEYSQRGLTNFLLNGEHHSEDDSWEVEWKLSPTFSNIVEPDLRRTPFTINAAQGDSSFEPGQGGNPKRIWRYLNEFNLAGKVDVVRNLKWWERDAKVKFGASQVFKYRDYEILDFDLVAFGNQPEFSGNPNEVLRDENLYPNGPLYYQAQFGNPNPNEYQSDNDNVAAYASAEFSPVLNVKTVFGLRAEYFVQNHTGRSARAASALRGNTSIEDLPADLRAQVLDNEQVLESFNLFPSANVIWSVNENVNLRASYFRSIARPSFKEMSFAQILDPTTNRTFNGGLFPYFAQDGSSIWNGSLQSTLINNYDLRWERFMDRGELISVSAFYKTFDNPIELVRIVEAQTTPEFQPRNVGDGQVYGAELEVRKNLGFISPAVEKFSFSGNFTYVYSQINMQVVEFEARQRFEKNGQTINETRDMAGQAPFVINGGITYDDNEKDLNVGIYYNVKGPTLAVVGGGLFPDVYSEPFHSLNATFNKTFGKDKKHALNIKAANLLMDVRESFYVGYQAQEQVFSRWEPGLQLSIGYSYSLN